MESSGNLSTPSSQGNNPNSSPLDYGSGLELGALKQRVEHLENDLIKQEISYSKEIEKEKALLKGEIKTVSEKVVKNIENIDKIVKKQEDISKKVNTLWLIGRIFLWILAFLIMPTLGFLLSHYWSNILACVVNILTTHN